MRSADLRKGFPEVSLPRPQLSYNRRGRQAWSGLAGLSHSFVGTGETWSHRRFSFLVVMPFFVCSGNFFSIFFSPPSFPHLF